jgi:hypothetical protein
MKNVRCFINTETMECQIVADARKYGGSSLQFIGPVIKGMGKSRDIYEWFTQAFPQLEEVLDGRHQARNTSHGN